MESIEDHGNDEKQILKEILCIEIGGGKGIYVKTERYPGEIFTVQRFSILK